MDSAFLVVTLLLRSRWGDDCKCPRESLTDHRIRRPVFRQHDRVGSWSIVLAGMGQDVDLLTVTRDGRTRGGVMLGRDHVPIVVTAVTQLERAVGAGRRPDVLSGEEQTDDH